MQIKFKYLLVNKILACILFLLIGTTAQAGKSLWAIVPIPGSEWAQTVPENAEGTIQYRVKNNTNAFRTLALWPVDGITQTTPCHVAPEGAVDDFCILNIAINGSKLILEGVKGGPRVCQTNSNGNPNANQCYTPNGTHSLDIKRGSAVNTLINVHPSVLTIPVEGTGVITITNSALSKEASHNLHIPNFSGNISIISTTCGLNLAVGASCTVTFTATTEQELTNIAIKGSNTNTANVAVQAVTPPALLTVTPATVYVFEHQKFDVIVKNRIGSRTAAENIIANIPSNSAISVANSTCGSSLAIGHSCTITFLAGAPEVPATITIEGSNTNTQHINTIVTNQAHASITSPEPQDRVVPVSGASLSLNLSYDTIGGPVTSFTVIDNPACPNLIVNDAGCVNLAPGSSCILELSSNTPYIPCTIAITGNNQALIAFSYLNGLVFESNGVNGKIVADSSLGFKSYWLHSAVNVNGTGFDGKINTDLIVNSPTCMQYPQYCAAQRCRDIGPEWYLPVIEEVITFYRILCPKTSCKFGGITNGLTYWSSSPTGQYYTIFTLSSGQVFFDFQAQSYDTRCIQQF
ncbi:hypothetical protein [uncultured Legionella sp.]|uniref:hypothetical protein n=1 Tax=uncultured Legionella sp. TaxID=210934 RepID=UPI00260B4053|nr:hypothetical protein [uncultured Legionella sp.]